ncbi:D-2-hydroxyacid dehydrogenase [Eremococcus coleocola]|uniref:4-phosphoerythronate dehydrogenase n=1 Tax=Eremococcus coleocola ACS-139-V-Col8 TaxID=908337 RepID=E4KMN9_9LACT|nr:D-2-hydroxyacid dehydrogenase [Eremococcus coleocola]EFR31768.1 4-phosphoerythronate dehydrogenase [Eremococcus coleocola ACS-139-V-Col8]
MKKIVMFSAKEEELEIAKNWAQENDVEIEFVEDILSTASVAKAAGADGITLSQVVAPEASVYEKLHELGIKQIAQRSAGTDMYDLDLATANDIIVTNVPSYSPESIAEFVVTSTMMMVRKVNIIKHRVKDQNFKWEPVIRAKTMHGMTVAILGTGRIGQIIGRLFNGFGAKVLGFDLYPNDQIRDFVDYQDSVEDTIKDADVVVLQMPLTKENHHLFDADMFAKMKDGAYFVNMARGGLVDTQALIDALDSGKIEHAALDTYEFEGDYIPKDWSNKPIEDDMFKRILDHEKIEFTPHIAYYTDTAVKNLVEGGLQATLDVINTGTTKNRVN